MEDVNLKVFNMIAGVNKSNTLMKNIFHVTVDVNLMVENVCQSKNGIPVSVYLSVKIQ